MGIEQIFFHLTYAFLLISAMTKLPPFARSLQILSVLALGSFLTLSSKDGYMWQVWSSGVVLFHLFFWKNYHSVTSRYEEFELDIWNEYFHDVSDEDFQLLLDSSDWRKFNFSGTISADKDYFVLKYAQEEKSWQKLMSSQTLINAKGDLKLFVDREALREANPLLETSILHLLTEMPRTSLAS